MKGVVLSKEVGLGGGTAGMWVRRFTETATCCVARYYKGLYQDSATAVYEDGRLRRLTPKEFFRLQGWTDEDYDKASVVSSETQLYKQAGNGVTTTVVKAIGEKMNDISR